MKDISLYTAADGWIYEVWVATRCIIVGFCWAREAAEREASIA